MRVDATVVVVAGWSTFRARRGRVTATQPHLMVLLDGEPKPMRFGDREVVEESNPGPMVAGE